MSQHMIPGVVDGTLTPAVDPDGNVSFHIVIRDIDSRRKDADYVEIVLTAQDARALMARPGQGAPVPCSVGVRLNTAPACASALQESS
ncbi:hypothetical protein CW362_40355 [Streptomyces populi]|uniref:Uncharacterized protein n=1 Tax=Streptomyces populi TaxID=2058924 RepID=A0A2I0SBZ5_9ACTN|nr:hypothetical protein [Streptomyces populi]PKT67456.1 hypothetical protein CW362_40355 [Streptomyces populi]